MEIKCKDIVLYPINELTPYPDNDKLHPRDDALIKTLCTIFQSEQGFTNPIRINAKTKMITCGHARVEALKEIGETMVPCIPIDYLNSDMEFADIVADNATNEWRNLDLSFINSQIPELGPMDIDLLGIKDFVVEPLDKFNQEKIDEPTEEEKKVCPQCGFTFF